MKRNSTARIFSVIGNWGTTLRVPRSYSLQSSGWSGCGAFAIEVHEVEQDRLRTKLPQHGCNLPTMVSAVIDHVHHRLPHRVCVHAKLKGLVLQHTVEVCLPDSAHKRQQAFLEFQPSLA